jgi:ADP-ribosyl-[dinitrogen reductase] hydrolase
MKTSISHPLKISTIEIGDVKIGLSLCPGKVQPNAISGSWARDLDLDLDAISKAGYNVVLSLIENFEIDELQVEKLRENAVQSKGMKWIHAPIIDAWIPNDSAFKKLEQALDLLNQGQSIFIHCKGGLGRAGLVAAWILTHYGRNATEAIKEVRKVRRGAIENTMQEKWVKYLAGIKYSTCKIQ